MREFLSLVWHKFLELIDPIMALFFPVSDYVEDVVTHAATKIDKSVVHDPLAHTLTFDLTQDDGWATEQVRLVVDMNLGELRLECEGYGSVPINFREKRRLLAFVLQWAEDGVEHKVAELVTKASDKIEDAFDEALDKVGDKVKEEVGELVDEAKEKVFAKVDVVIGS